MPDSKRVEKVFSFVKSLHPLTVSKPLTSNFFMKHTSISSALFFCALLVAGCGGNVKVTGKVAFPDGEPLSTGQVIFESEKMSGMGKLSADGSYTLGSDKEENGIPKGKYRVYITGAITYAEVQAPNPSAGMPGVYNPGSTGSPLPSSIPLVHRKFLSVETSDIEVDVQGAMTYDITVEKP
jgi:hypothetical protein